MSKQIDDGGLAFPHQDWDACIKSQRLDTGMTLRDYFAAAALTGLLANVRYQFDKGEVQNGVARDVCSLADAMIEARKEKTQP
jgi:hypothetical protein